MSVKVTSYSGGTAAANQLWTANQSCFVQAAALGSSPVYVQAGVTTVFSSEALFQNTPASMWSPHQVDHFIVGQ